MAGAFHPTVQAHGYGVDIAVRVREVLSDYAPFDARSVNALSHASAFGIVVSEEILFGHAAAVIASHREQIFRKPQRHKLVLLAQAIHLIQTLLLKRFDLLKQSLSARRLKQIIIGYDFSPGRGVSRLRTALAALVLARDLTAPDEDSVA